MAVSKIKQIFSQAINKEPVKKPTPSPLKPKTLFEEKKKWNRRDLTGKMIKASPYIPGAGGAICPKGERIKMIKQIFPEKTFGTHISETSAKRALRGLRKEEHRAKTGFERQETRRKRLFIERETGLKGKY